MSQEERPGKKITAQIRPSMTIDDIITLEALQKGKPLGKIISELLKESPTFTEKQEELKRFKG